MFKDRHIIILFDSTKLCLQTGENICKRGYLFAPAKGFPGSASGKEPACQCRKRKRLGFNPWVKKIPWRRAWQPTPVFLPGESHGQRNLAGCSPVGCKELDKTEVISQTHVHTYNWSDYTHTYHTTPHTHTPLPPPLWCQTVFTWKKLVTLRETDYNGIFTSWQLDFSNSSFLDRDL